MKKSKKKLSWWKKLIIIVCSVAIFVCAILAGFRLAIRIPVKHYYDISEIGFVIPDLDKNFVPQGISYDDRTKDFFLTGYTNDSKASPIYMVNKETGNCEKKINLLTKDGECFLGHNGGIQVYGNYVYIAGAADACVYVYSYSDCVSANNGDSIKMLGEFSLVCETDEIRSSFLTIINDNLVVGEFYREGNYETLKSHHIAEANMAYAVGFRLSDAFESTYGIAPNPSFAISIPNLCQGMCADGSTLYCSTSYGLANSHIYKYDLTKALSLKRNVLGLNIDFFVLDESAKKGDLLAPPMAEEIEIVDGKMYTNCESASNKYIFGKFTSSKYCYATDITKF